MTREQYHRFAKDYKVGGKAELPAGAIDWYMAARYCNWLSKEEAISKDQWCYEVWNENEISLKAGYLSRSGYRLPTEAEMEYAIRAGTVTARYYGETEELLPKYAWYMSNSQEQPWPVGSLKPNDLGFFDLHGNVWTWCQERYQAYKGKEDKEDVLDVITTEFRVLRGGSCINQGSLVRSAVRLGFVPTYRNNSVGFRPARTFTP